jgi:hypothetical protein
MTADDDIPTQRAEALVVRLRNEGHHAEADRVQEMLDRHAIPSDDDLPAEQVRHGFLHGLRDVCQAILTAIEAIDPSSGTAIEELRLEVDKRLFPHGVHDEESI